MKSKTSFFNKAVYRKNFTLFWPIWAGFLLIELLKGPGCLWVQLHRPGMEPLEALQGSVSLEAEIPFFAVASALTAMALFHYLFSTKSANLLHALPVTRRELYVTNLLSGFTFLFVPLVLSFFFSVLVCLACGVAEVQYLFMWLLVSLGICFFLFAEAVFCGMFTGLLLALPVYFVLCNLLVVGIMVELTWVLTEMSYGLSMDTLGGKAAGWLSPLVYLCDEVRISGNYAQNEKGVYVIRTMELSGGKAVICYAFAAVLIYLLAYYCYKKREMERTGDLLVFDWVKPVFRWGVGICTGFFGGALLMNILKDFIPDAPAGIWLVFVLGIGALAFFLAEMLIEKAFRVLNKKRMAECLVFLGFTLLAYGAIYGCAYRLSTDLPRADQVEYAYVRLNYPLEFSGEETEELLEVHREILSKQSVFERALADSGQTVYVSFVYQMADGDRMERWYAIPAGSEASGHVLGKIYAWEQEPEAFLRNQLQYDYTAVNRFTDVQLEWYDSTRDNYVYLYGGSDAAVALYEAVQEDLEEGTLQKYNLTDYGMSEEKEAAETLATISLSFYYAGGTWQTMYDRMNREEKGINQLYVSGQEMYYVKEASDSKGCIYLSFGEDCTHILDALEKYGLGAPAVIE
ncbi:MAG: hypothetical protein NC180_03415 [Muribaculaceae bacterium]|nr:hypothetical protein [Roseburia sp.]MCM1431258.1 hypothetical protein [Muribaculaceae bacterium]MCM1492256.1 hypothetical protein [Muribaculaceae bacterium]